MDDQDELVGCLVYTFLNLIPSLILAGIGATVMAREATWWLPAIGIWIVGFGMLFGVLSYALHLVCMVLAFSIAWLKGWL